MMRGTDARSEILRAIRQNLKASTLHDLHAAGPAHGPARLPVLNGARPTSIETAVAAPADLVARFAQQLNAVGAACSVVTDAASAASALSRLLSDAGARRVVGSDAPLVRRLLQLVDGEFSIRDVGAISRDELFACDAGVTAAQWAIADTGTLVLESLHERSRLVSLVPRVHIALLDAANVCATIADALARVRTAEADGSLANRAITFITGPSRTSDIELTLVIGVHGPQQLHVIVIDPRTPEVVQP